MKANPDLYFLNQLKNGQEAGLNHFYNRLYPVVSYWAFKRVKDDVAASSIAQEAFLKLWLVRAKINDIKELITFLSQRVKQGCTDFYRQSSARFHRGLIKLDDIGNYQEFIGAYEPEVVCQEELDEQKMAQWQEIERALPNLSQDQQLFIRLCLRYAFSYDRIAWHLGGIADYEVARKVEKTLAALKNIITGAKKLNTVTTAKKFLFEGELNAEQAQILHMRYELNCSFEEIALELGLSQAHVQTVFVQAYTAISWKKSKSS